MRTSLISFNEHAVKSSLLFRSSFYQHYVGEHPPSSSPYAEEMKEKEGDKFVMEEGKVGIEKCFDFPFLDLTSLLF